MRRPYLIAGNWKMNHGPAETEAFFASFDAPRHPEVEVLLCVPYVSLPAALVRAGYAKIGAQNLHFENDGAYTGEVSGSMLRKMGVDSVIIGHSERRQYFGETDALVLKKTLKALEAGLTPIVCVGEVLAERRAGTQVEVVKRQIDAVFPHLDTAQASAAVIAYEPVWAIGTGETATPEQAQEMHAHIRSWLASDTRILYGGSMNAANAASLLMQPDVDGGLIGGASLKPDLFMSIVQTAIQLR
jgi:triosephosphate isomerase (TIM)